MVLPLRNPRWSANVVDVLDISYWKHEVGSLGFFKEVAGAVATGGVANTGSLREMKSDEIKEYRKKHGALSSKA